MTICTILEEITDTQQFKIFIKRSIRTIEKEIKKTPLHWFIYFQICEIKKDQLTRKIRKKGKNKQGK